MTPQPRVEDSVINGSVNISGYDGFWQGFFRNTVNGSVNFNDTVLNTDGNARSVLR